MKMDKLVNGVRGANGAGSVKGALAGKEFQATEEYDLERYASSVFLGGSIAQDTAEKWQPKMVKALLEYDVAVLNPRRREWKGDMEQSVDNPEFVAQVLWEYRAMDKADVIVLYFAVGTPAPIVLQELGYYGAVRPKNLVVCCPDGFWRKGNVEVFCMDKGIFLVKTFEKMMDEVRMRLKAKGADGQGSCAAE